MSDISSNNLRKWLAEFFGTALLLIGVVGSGIMGENLADGNVALALLANAIATGCMLFVIITVFGPISGAHFNPAVTIAFLIRGEIRALQAGIFLVMQVSGGILGVFVAHAMFGMDLIQFSDNPRTGSPLWVSEIVATAGLLMVIFGGLRHRPDQVPMLVAIYITGAYWFTASTSFANPAVTIARSFTDSFAGISPDHVTMFIAAQALATLLATPLLGWMFSKSRP